MKENSRNKEGKFTYSTGENNSISSKTDDDREKNQQRADILFPTMNDSKNIDNSIFSDDTWKKTREFIINEESFREKAYKPTPNDLWTIGYGHTENVKEGDIITKEQAEELFKQDFKKYSSPLKRVTVPLNDNEKVALTSFIYNIGPNAFTNSTLLNKLNKGDKKGAADEFDKWVYQKGKKLNGLVNRRKKEKDLFLKPVD